MKELSIREMCQGYQALQKALIESKPYMKAYMRNRRKPAALQP